MRAAVIAFLTATVLLFSASGANSEETATANLDALVLEAADHNPEIRAAEAEWLGAQQRIPQSAALQDPMAGIDVMGADTETKVGPQKQRYSISQKIPFPLKLSERGRMASEAANAAKQRYLRVRRDVIYKLKTAYYDLYQADASLAVISEIQDLLKKFEAVAQARYSNVSGSQRDVAKAEAEVSLTLEQSFRLKQKRASIVAYINSILDRDPLQELESTQRPSLPTLDQTLPELADSAKSHRQEIKEMEAMLESGRSAKRLAYLQYIPDAEVGFNYTVVGDGSTALANDGQDSWMFPIRFNIPLWQNRLVPSIREAQERVEAAEAALRQSRNTVSYEVKDAYLRYQTAANISTLYETAVIPQAKLALSSDQAGYEGGQRDFLNLLDSERVYLNAKLSAIKIYAEALKGYVELERSTGMNWGKGEVL